jgi:hypothetical protein
MSVKAVRRMLMKLSSAVSTISDGLIAYEETTSTLLFCGGSLVIKSALINLNFN